MNLEKNLERILISKNWNNILLRNEIREDIIFFNEKIDERLVFEYLHNLNNEQLIDIRKKVFKLAKDHYIEILINQITIKPILKDVDENFTNKYFVKCNIMKDVIECLDFIVNSSTCLPERCTEFRNEKLQFPLGKKNLMAQLNAIKMLRLRIINHQKELQDFKQFTIEIDKLEKSLMVSKAKFQAVQRQNFFLKTCLTILLIVLIVLAVGFLFTNCLNRYSNRSK